MLEIHFGAEQETLRTFVTVLDQITNRAAPLCPQCSAALPAWVRFCASCGTPS